MIKRERRFSFFARFLLVFFICFLLIDFSSALSVIPASVYLDFQPNNEYVLDYYVRGVKTNADYSLYLTGELAQYATLSKSELKGEGSFKVFLSLPNSLEKPGKNFLQIGVKEKVDDELGGSMIGTAIEIVVLVTVYVPYPGKYVEVSFSGESVNVGEPLEFKIDAINRGKEAVTIYPRIEIFSNVSGEKIETLYLEDRLLDLTQKISLRKVFDTSEYNPGRYSGVAVLEYGGDSPSRAETSFRLGELNIGIKNFTKQVILDGKIQKFGIEIESEWNDQIDGVYAQVVFSNYTSEVLSFKTSSTSLKPFEFQTIVGYFDTLYFNEGFYNANITLFYYGRDVGKSSSKLVQVEFIKEPISTPILIVGILLGLILLFVAIIFFLKMKSRKK